MTVLRTVSVFLFCACSVGLTQNQDEPGTEQNDAAFFLEAVRRPPERETWCMMEGKAVHRRRGREIREAEVYLGVRFTSDRILARFVAGGNEGYFISQSYESGADSTSIISDNGVDPEKSILANFGLRPEDLTLSFIYWDMVKEVPETSVRGAGCRVFLLKSPKSEERAVVAISEKYGFPLKISIFPDNAHYKKGKVLRTLEISAFKKVNELYTVTDFLVYGPGWKTKVGFEELSADYCSNSIPENLFRKNSNDATGD